MAQRFFCRRGWRPNKKGIKHFAFKEFNVYNVTSHFLNFREAKNDRICPRRERCSTKTSMVVHVLSCNGENELGYELLPYSPDSQDLTLIDYFLFSNLNKWFDVKIMGSNNEIIALTNVYFKDLDKFYHLEGDKQLEKHETKCMERKVY